MTPLEREEAAIAQAAAYERARAILESDDFLEQCFGEDLSTRAEPPAHPVEILTPIYPAPPQPPVRQELSPSPEPVVQQVEILSPGNTPRANPLARRAPWAALGAIAAAIVLILLAANPFPTTTIESGDSLRRAQSADVPEGGSDEPIPQTEDTRQDDVVETTSQDSAAVQCEVTPEDFVDRRLHIGLDRCVWLLRSDDPDQTLPEFTGPELAASFEWCSSDHPGLDLTADFSDGTSSFTTESLSESSRISVRSHVARISISFSPGVQTRRQLLECTGILLREPFVLSVSRP